VWDLFGEFAHLTLSLSFQERGPALAETERIDRKR